MAEIFSQTWGLPILVRLGYNGTGTAIPAHTCVELDTTITVDAGDPPAVKVTTGPDLYWGITMEAIGIAATGKVMRMGIGFGLAAEFLYPGPVMADDSGKLVAHIVGNTMVGQVETPTDVNSLATVMLSAAPGGARGEKGNAFLGGARAPTGSDGIEADFWWNYDTGLVYRKSAGVWNIVLEAIASRGTSIIAEEGTHAARLAATGFKGGTFSDNDRGRVWRETENGSLWALYEWTPSVEWKRLDPFVLDVAFGTVGSLRQLTDVGVGTPSAITKEIHAGDGVPALWYWNATATEDDNDDDIANPSGASPGRWCRYTSPLISQRGTHAERLGATGFHGASSFSNADIGRIWFETNPFAVWMLLEWDPTVAWKRVDPFVLDVAYGTSGSLVQLTLVDVGAPSVIVRETHTGDGSPSLWYWNATSTLAQDDSMVTNPSGLLPGRWIRYSPVTGGFGTRAARRVATGFVPGSSFSRADVGRFWEETDTGQAYRLTSHNPVRWDLVVTTPTIRGLISEWNATEDVTPIVTDIPLLETWTREYITSTPGQTDSDGGTEAEEWLETTATNMHDGNCELRGAAIGPIMYTLRVKSIGGRNVWIADGAVSTFIKFDLTAGTWAAGSGGEVGSISALADGWWLLTAYFPAVAAPNYLRVLCATTTHVYTGDITKGLLVHAPTIQQLRAISWKDQSGQHNLENTALEQWNASTKPFLRNTNLSPGWPGIDTLPDVFVPTDVAGKVLSNADAELCDVFETGSEFTVCALVNLLAASTGDVELLKAAGATNSVTVGVDANRRPFIKGTGMSTILGLPLTVLTPQLLVWTMSGTVGSIYQDGTLRVSKPAVLSTIAATSVTSSQRSSATGWMAVSNVELTAKEIAPLSSGVRGTRLFRLAGEQIPVKFVSQLAGVLDDSTRRISTSEEVTIKRAELVRATWGTAGLPTSVPTVTVGIVPPVTNLTNLLRVDSFSLDMPGESLGGPITVTCTGYHFVPAGGARNEVVFLSFGHYWTVDDSQDPGNVGTGAWRTIKTLLNWGFAVVVYYMPPVTVGIPSHNWLFENVPDTEADGSAMRFFLSTATAALNYWQSQYSHYHIVGLSGGGWSATLLPALDARWENSYSVAGTQPFYMRSGGSIGDYEQTWVPFYWRAGYLDLYVMAALGRRHVQSYNDGDDCCFGPDQYTDVGCGARIVGLTYEQALTDFETEIQGVVGAAAFQTRIDMASVMHQITWDTAAWIVADLIA